MQSGCHDLQRQGEHLTESGCLDLHDEQVTNSGHYDLQLCDAQVSESRFMVYMVNRSHNPM